MSPFMLCLWKAVILPPGIIIIFLTLALLLSIKWPRIGRSLLALGLLCFYLLSTPFVASALINPLETAVKPLNLEQPDPKAQAIVVLTGGNVYGPEYKHGEGPSGASMARIRYAMAIYAVHPLPIIISGGKTGNEQENESTLLEQILITHFKINNVLTETASRNTFENAKYLKPLLAKQGITHFYLVDSAWHMPRTLWTFRHMGLDPIPAPTDYLDFFARPKGERFRWQPSISALYVSTRALYEYCGQLDYYFRYGEIAKTMDDTPDAANPSDDISTNNQL